MTDFVNHGEFSIIEYVSNTSHAAEVLKEQANGTLSDIQSQLISDGLLRSVIDWSDSTIITIVGFLAPLML